MAWWYPRNASWLLKQESTQLMNNLEQECLEQNFRLIPFCMVQLNSPIHSSMITRLPIPKVTSPIVCQLAGQNTEEMPVVCDYPDAPRRITGTPLGKDTKFIIKFHVEWHLFLGDHEGCLPMS